MLTTSYRTTSWGGWSRTTNFLINSQIPVAGVDVPLSSVRLKTRCLTAGWRHRSDAEATGEPRIFPGHLSTPELSLRRCGVPRGTIRGTSSPAVVERPQEPARDFSFLRSLIGGGAC